MPVAGTYRIEAEARDAEYLTATASIHVVAGEPPAAGGGAPGSGRPHVHGRAWVSASSSSGESCWSEDQPEMVLA